jgi:methylthioribose-1-phosphate isomerase
MESHIRYDTEREELTLLDQRLLPGREEYFVCRSCDDVVTALSEMVVRGAPAIGVAAAWGCVQAALEALGGVRPAPAAQAPGPLTRFVRQRPVTRARAAFIAAVKRRSGRASTKPARRVLSSIRMPAAQALFERLAERIASARPTAVNLRRAVRRMCALWTPESAPEEIMRRMRSEAAAIQREDIAANRAIGKFGAPLVPKGARVMTHCNAGALAAAGYGTALGVVRAAWENDKSLTVIANETRPFLQGARLTAYELAKDGIPVRVACDNACALLMRRGLVDCVIVGADRIAANGDTVNKIGTYGAAISAREHGIPLYVAAPCSTIDPDSRDGDAVPIEERDPREVTHMNGLRITPPGVEVFNFAFDVTPARLINAIITERGVLRPPFDAAIRALFL